MPVFKVHVPWLAKLEVIHEADNEKEAIEKAEKHSNPMLCTTCSRWLKLEGADKEAKSKVAK